MEAKTSQAILDQCRYDYETGNFKSVYELAERYGINKNTLHQRVIREKWEELRLKKVKEIESKLEKKALSVGEEYLLNTFKRAKRYEKIIDSSMENLGSKDAEGNPLLDPDAINTFTLAETRIHELAKSALRIPDIRNLDVTSKGQSLGESLVSAIQKLRETDKTPPLTSADCDRILEAEIVDDKQE